MIILIPTHCLKSKQLHLRFTYDEFDFVAHINSKTRIESDKSYINDPVIKKEIILWFLVRSEYRMCWKYKCKKQEGLMYIVY